MGIIKKQSIVGTFYIYVGVVLGFITTGIVFPNILNPDEIGLLKLLVSIAVMVSQFAGLGFHSPTARLFPYFRDKEKGHHGFLTLSLTVSLLGAIIFITVIMLLKPWLVRTYEESSAMFIEYFYFLIPLIIFTLFFNTLNAYYKSLYNIVVGVALKDVWQRVFILIVVFAYYFGWIDFSSLVFLYVLAIGIPAILIIISLIKCGEFRLIRDKGFITHDLARSLFNMSLYGIMNSFSGVMVLNIDILMINHLLGLGQTGIYTVTMYFGTLVSIPARSIRNISSIIIADAWKDNNKTLVNDIYKKSCLVLTTIGLLLLVGIWTNIHNIFGIIGTDYFTGRYVILFIAIANLLDMMTGVSKITLNTSKYYHYLTWSILLLFVLIVTTNLIFIPYFGTLFGKEYSIVGAAFASFLSKLIYNLVVWAFLWRKFGFQPFNYKYFLLAAIAVISYLASSLLPVMSLLPLDILVRGFIVTAVYLFLVYMFNISSDINSVIRSVIGKLSG